MRVGNARPAHPSDPSSSGSGRLMCCCSFSGFYALILLLPRWIPQSLVTVPERMSQEPQQSPVHPQSKEGGPWQPHVAVGHEGRYAVTVRGSIVQWIRIVKIGSIVVAVVIVVVVDSVMVIVKVHIFYVCHQTTATKLLLSFYIRRNHRRTWWFFAACLSENILGRERNRRQDDILKTSVEAWSSIPRRHLDRTYKQSVKLTARRQTPQTTRRITKLAQKTNSTFFLGHTTCTSDKLSLSSL